MGYRVGVDSGGTFTDLLAIDENGHRQLLKVPSTPESPDLGFKNALTALIDRLDGQAAQIDAVLHGTTVAVNAILQRKFPEMGLLVTRGFRHILELARQTVPGERGSIYVWVKPPRIVPLSNVREVTERITAKGEVIEPFDEAECREAARWYREQGIGTVAICFINAYVDGTHERSAKEIFKEEFPECHVAVSSETLPEFREYERAVTTCMNALLMPILGDYVARLREHMASLGLDAPLYIMKSGGGASRADLAIEQPVHTALSGPAAAVAGAAWLGRQAGMEQLITFDMGGTSTDVSLIEGGKPALVTETEIDVYPIRTPTIDVVSVGAGGGSLAWLAPGDRLRVGPRSAGADPGPACYGRGGEDVTITDANFYLGRLPEDLAGGTVALNRAHAEKALARLGDKVGLAPLDLANGIVQIGEMNMADAIRQVSVQKGRDPRLFRLVASGGAGPLHACALAEILKIPEVVVPLMPGIGCSLGALVSDVREDYVATEIQRESDADIDKIVAIFAELEARAVRALERQGFSQADRGIVRSADLRYRGMRTELTVAVDSGKLDAGALQRMFAGLHEAHDVAYGYAYEGVQQVELVNIRVAGIGRMPVVPAFSVGKAGRSPKPVATRQVYFTDTGWADVDLFDRDQCGAGTAIQGPAIVQQYDSTTVIHPGQRATIAPSGDMMVATRAGQATVSDAAATVPA